MFAEKVIKYLWDDAFKFFRDKLFVSSYKSLEEVINVFSENKANKRFDIFIDSIKNELMNNLVIPNPVDIAEPSATGDDKDE